MKIQTEKVYFAPKQKIKNKIKSVAAVAEDRL